jgi:mono/diheme cytochrome c family protein
MKPFKPFPLLILLVALSSACKRGSGPSAAIAGSADRPTDAVPEGVTFNAHIRPIFSDTCFACHGFDAEKREADLRLDTPEGAYAKLKDSEERAIVPGNPDASAILKRMTSDDPDEVMPPPEFHKTLNPRQKDLVRAWIAQGATYEQHWAFTPIEKPARPSVSAAEVDGVNPIDAFILAGLEKEKLQPAPLADKATLLRRLSLDLIGLPPSLEELDGFLADDQPQSYERQVERLLASPRYGERMAVPWLDVVRFADSVGYHGDQNARIFPYRDYVIHAFNENKPFDQFTIEQIAGDLLPNATDEQRIATGFLRLNLMTREGGAQPGEYLAKSMADRVRAIGTAWLGLTTGCAECHDHKFDPLTAQDFYSLGAFFADVRQWGVYAEYQYTPNPDLRGVNNDWPFPPEIYAKNAALEQRISQLQTAAVNELAGSHTPAEWSMSQEWAKSASSFLTNHATGWLPLTATEITVTKGTLHEPQADGSVVFSGPVQKDEVLTLDLALPTTGIRAIRFEVLPDPKNADQVGRQANGQFRVIPSFELVANETPAPLAIAWSQADRRTPLRYQNGEEIALLEPEWRSAPGIWEEPRDATSLPHHAIYHLSERVQPAEGQRLRVRMASGDIGRVRFSVTPFGDAVPGREAALRDELAAALRSSPEALSDPQRREWVAAWKLATVPDASLPDTYRQIRAAIIACRAGYAHSLIAQPLPTDKIPPTHVLPRGNWMTPAAEVQPAFPEFLANGSITSSNRRLNRLDLAQWLMAKENPLTARHFTNRLWKQFFGKGLSNVLDDLGNQGEWPSHPQLLDWLAAEFRDSGWDVKHMVRLIVTSRTYRQVSSSREDLREIDPANRLLAEQSPRRLDAEFVRDNALAIAGLLNQRITGGPSVKPYQPAGYWVNLNFPERGYAPSGGEDQYRRGVYVHWQRTFMHPMLAGFDAPSREECTADRYLSNSPQQALTLLNDPSFVEAAHGFALRLEGEVPAGGEEEKIIHAIKLALARAAKPGEVESLRRFLAAQRQIYQGKPADAQALLKIGESTSSAEKDLIELAAWTQLCRVILNLHESITRY